MTTISAKKIQAGYEPIPGYVLEEVIGRGGFGEVWRSSAPGGLKKAVKFVFGAHGESRAARELRSLERIRGVQHPFLLTLERFEAIEDQLVIVTELADCSLEDVQKRYRDKGSCGIPRDMLVSYLQDAADALDYLHNSYQLQHLDIKPGNLLLVGGHVKVADFGLLKDLRDIEVSVVGGLTPIYAPPELFDGRPNKHSDQYSLAVMYQELLTGARPFSGRTIAQLATQHVHSAPNLEPLPPSDRPVIARALEKNPERRFPDCKSFVASLRDPRVRPVRGADLSEREQNYEVPAEKVEDLPQLPEAASRSLAIQHVLVLAIGGTGAECLRELRRRAAEPTFAERTDLHSVLIDTDMATIHSMGVAEISDRVPPCKTIYTPLKTAAEYRQNGTEKLRTISRRWIYNVPRSGSTEGMRPLGRLALVDHGAAVCRRLTDSIADLVQSCHGRIPSVYVVGSLTGGTCSGMYIDAVHLLRHLLDEAGLEEAQIQSMLAIAPFQVNPANPLALHDTQAALIEMNHYLNAGNGYPGDPGAGWPSVPAARTPLRDVYLVAGSTHCSIAPKQVDSISDYIWSDVTGAGSLLAAARVLKLKDENAISLPSVRSVGVVPLADARCVEQKSLAPAVVRELLVGWLGLPSKARHAAVILSERIMRRTGIFAGALQKEVKSQLDDRGLPELLKQAISELDTNDLADRAGLVAKLMPVIEQVASSIEFQGTLENMVKSLYRELSVCLTDRKADVTTVMECLRLIQVRSAEAIAELRSPASPAQAAADQIAADLIVACQLEQFSDNLRLLEARYDRFTTTLALAIAESKRAQGPEANPWSQLSEQIRSQFQFVVVQLHEASVNRYLIRPLANATFNQDPSLLVNELTDATIPFVSELYGDAQGLQADDMRFSVAATAELSTTSLPGNESQSLTAVTAQFHPVRKRRNLNEPLSVEEAVVAVKPALLAFGGLQRLVLIVGSEREKEKLEAQVRDCYEGTVTVAVIPGAAPRLIHEAQQIHLKDILAKLTSLNGSNAQITSRLSSRTDGDW
jgi:eukaryotic-like serine/threonine-protein kinase